MKRCTVVLLFCLPFLLHPLSLRSAELAPDLRTAVDELIVAVEESPSNRDNAASRMAIVWRWANAISLEGGFVPKNLPLVAHYIPYPTPGYGITPYYLEALDLYVRQLAMLERDPGALGKLSVEPAIEAVAHSWQTIQVRFEVGSRGIDAGGGFLISGHWSSGYSPLQADDPAGEGFVSIQTDRAGITFEIDQAPVWGPYGGFLAPKPFPAYRVRGGRLQPGDTVTLTYGDRSGGGPGFRVGSFSNSAIALPLFVDPGEGRFYEMPPAIFRVVGGAATGVHGFAPSIVAVGESFEISVRSEDRFLNRASSEIPGYQVLKDGEPFRSLEAGRAIHTLEITLEREGIHRFSFRSPDGRIQGVANPVWVRAAPEHRIYWGETHGHCGFAEGQGTPEGYFAFARDDARLDFVTLSEHDSWLTDGMWRELDRVVKRFRNEDALVVFPGYEWTSKRQRGGHHNVFFRVPGMARIGFQEAPDLTDLYQGLRAIHDPRDVLIIPHAHQAGDWRLSDPDMQHLVEIMSGHGSFEWFGQRYLEHGHQVGFVAASDDHVEHPGYAPGWDGWPGFHLGGLAGVVSQRGDSDSLFAALKARSTYATTGSRRIILEAQLNGHRMGTRQEMSEERKVEGRVVGTAPIRGIELIKNGEVIDRFDLGPFPSDELGDTEVAVGFYSDSEVHIRDNPRQMRTWRGVLTVAGAQLSGARFLGSPHSSDRLERDGNRIVFDLTTRGARRVVAIQLDGVSQATRFTFDLEANREAGWDNSSESSQSSETVPVQVRTPDRFPVEHFALALPQGAEISEKILATDHHEDLVTIERIRRRDDVQFHFIDRGRPGDWYYVRVEQVDGHLAWTSPWWVGGEPPR